MSAFKGYLNAGAVKALEHAKADEVVLVGFSDGERAVASASFGDRTRTAEQCTQLRMDLEAQTTLGEDLAFILARAKCGVHITVNEHRDFYQTIYDHLEASGGNASDDIDPEVFAEMRRTDTLVAVQVYPDTPIGFYVIHHYSLDAAIRSMRKVLEHGGD